MENSLDNQHGSSKRGFSRISKVALAQASPDLAIHDQPIRFTSFSEEDAESELGILPPTTEVGPSTLESGHFRRTSFPTDTARGKASLQFSGFGSRKLRAASAEFVRQTSKKIYGSAREYASPSFSSVRALSFAELERGSRRYSRDNSLTFGQVVAVDHDDFLEQVLDRLEEQGDLEAGEKVYADPVLHKEMSLKRPNSGQIAPGEPQKRPSTKTEPKSRIGTLILEQSWLTVYKRLYLAAIVLNAVGVTLAATNHFPYAKSKAVVFVVGNIMMSVLVRNEVFLRGLYWLAVKILGHWWIPLRLKTMMTSLLQSLGGIHSGCGLGALMWLSYALDLTFQNRRAASDEMVGVAFGILGLLVLTSLAAFPVVRHIHHNFFEIIHRFAGWTSLALVWAFVLLSTFWDPATQSYRVSSRSVTELARMQALWFTVATTVMIILPWLGVRKVAVETVVSANKFNSLIQFEGGVKPGYLARISRSPFSEWHAFGIISDGQKRHTILAGAVGDFTKSLVENPPTHVWVRSIHFAGLPYLCSLYQRVLMVATGSGIGVYLSFLLQPQRNTEVHLIWIAKKIRDSFGDGLWEAVNDAPAERITLIDTAVSGRPKTKELVLTKAKEWKPDVVVVTSNPIGTNEIVSACKAVGIPAFGPIWDS